jgi:hypothetical protein
LKKRQLFRIYLCLTLNLCWCYLYTYVFIHTTHTHTLTHTEKDLERFEIVVSQILMLTHSETNPTIILILGGIEKERLGTDARIVCAHICIHALSFDQSTTKVSTCGL